MQGSIQIGIQRIRSDNQLPTAPLFLLQSMFSGTNANKNQIENAEVNQRLWESNTEVRSQLSGITIWTRT